MLFRLFAIVAQLLGKGCLEEVELSGPLYKLPVSGASIFVDRWKLRHFVLLGSRLSYYAKEGDATPKGVVELTSDLFLRDITFNGRAQRSSS